LKDRKKGTAHTGPESEELLRAVGRIAQAEKVPVYAVGGCVRDRMLEIGLRDIDFVAVGDGPRFAEKVKTALGGHGFVVYEKFGTASFVASDHKLEFVSARRESYDTGSRKPSVESTDLATDLSRRDFTVNAMAMAVFPETFGEITDPFDGRGDLDRRILKTPLDPKSTFSDDPLRILRAARFASQLDFSIDPAALNAMEEERERLTIVSQERITDEFLKILSHAKPSIGLRVLQNTGVLSVIFPELAALVGVEQRDEYHHKDVFEHTLKVLDNLSAVTDDPLLRFAALVHDIGKPRVKRFVSGTGWTFYGHEQMGVRMLKGITGRMKLPGEFYKYGQKLTRLHMRPIQLIGEEVSDSAVRRLLFQAGQEIDDLMILCKADITSGNPKLVKRHLENFNRVISRMKEVEESDRLRAFQPPVRGDEIMAAFGIRPGPEVGRLKKLVEEAILDGLIPNEHDAAVEYLQKIKANPSD
jgi:poly(A) polymerase